MESPVQTKRNRSESLDREQPPAKRHYLSLISFPEPVNRILLRQRFLSSPDLEHPLEGLRDKDDELVVQKWLEGNSVCCSRSKTGFCYCGKEPKEPTPSLPSEILHEIFEMTIPPDALLDPSLSCGPYSAWCNSMVTKRSLVLVSKAWYEAGIDLLYRSIFIRRVIAIETLLATLTDNPRLDSFVRNLTIMCFVPRIYRAAIHPDLTQILNFCPTVKIFNHLPPFPPPKPFPFPALPSTVTSLKLSIHDTLSAVYGTLQQCCAQLEDLSVHSHDDEMFDAHKLSFPRLHTLHLTLKESTSVQSFSTEWDMPRL